MLKRLSLAAFLVSCAAILRADGPLSTSHTIGPDKLHYFTVTNTSSADLTGMTVLVVLHVQESTHPALSRQFYDFMLNSRQPPLKPGQSHTFGIGTGEHLTAPMEPSVEAAVFSDGSAVGDTAAIKSLWERRDWLIQGYNEVFAIIASSVPDINNRAEAVKILTQFEATRFSGSMPLEQRVPLKAAYETVIGNLRDNVRMQPDAIVASLKKKQSDRQALRDRQLAPKQLLWP